MSDVVKCCHLAAGTRLYCDDPMVHNKSQFYSSRGDAWKDKYIITVIPSRSVIVVCLYKLRISSPERSVMP